MEIFYLWFGRFNVVKMSVPSKLFTTSLVKSQEVLFCFSKNWPADSKFIWNSREPRTGKTLVEMEEELLPIVRLVIKWLRVAWAVITWLSVVLANERLEHTSAPTCTLACLQKRFCRAVGKGGVSHPSRWVSWEPGQVGINPDYCRRAHTKRQLSMSCRAKRNTCRCWH